MTDSFTAGSRKQPDASERSKFGEAVENIPGRPGWIRITTPGAVRTERVEPGADQAQPSK